MRRLLSPLPLAILVGVVALLGLLGYGLVSKGADTGIERALASGENPPAAALSLPRLGGGGTASLADFRGQVVVLNYWASWCTPCRSESPLLERWHRRLKARGGTMLGVDVLDASSDARAFVREFGLTYPMLRDRDGRTRQQFGIAGLPETLVIDRRGRIRAVARGPVGDRFMRIEVEPLLSEPA